MAAGLGLPMTRLEIDLRSAGQSSIDPRGVFVQSKARANFICGGSVSEIGSLVQSKMRVEDRDCEACSVRLIG